MTNLSLKSSRHTTQRIKKAPDILLEIDIATEFPGWKKCGFDIEATINRAVHAAIEKSTPFPAIKDKTGEISIVLSDDGFIQNLNKEYRDKDKPTNVLSFPQIDFQQDIPADNLLTMGDIILAYGVITQEAKEQNKSLEDHFTHLIVHGTLHLLGYDHETTIDAEEMESLEIIILKQAGIENPYSDINFVA